MSFVDLASYFSVCLFQKDSAFATIDDVFTDWKAYKTLTKESQIFSHGMLIWTKNADEFTIYQHLCQNDTFAGQTVWFQELSTKFQQSSDDFDWQAKLEHSEFIVSSWMQNWNVHDNTLPSWLSFGHDAEDMRTTAGAGNEILAKLFHEAVHNNLGVMITFIVTRL